MPEALPPHTWKVAAVVIGFILAGTALGLAVLFGVTRLVHARELYPGQYSQVDPKTRQWFQDQKSPKGVPCCSTADGTYVEEDIRGDHYWIKFDKTGGSWMEVPDDVVIRKPNPHGAAVVWYYYDPGNSYGKPEFLKFRCFVPGAGL